LILFALLLLQQERSKLEHYLAGSANDPVVIVTALVLAFFLGAAHALTPGHGKTIVAAYLVGSRGRIADAIYLGGVVTATHTASVFALGIATLYASTRIALDRIFPWLSLLSGTLVAGIGTWLLKQRLGAGAESTVASDRPGPHHGHSHHHHHTHAHSHSHAAPAKGTLLSLGISGGLVPCPEALVVLLVSVSLNRLVFGLALLVMFSVGLAAVLITIGCAMVIAGPKIRRISAGEIWPWRLSVISAVVVTVAGLVMIGQAVRSL
jgi:ABC-type nickel/cobalt efflux system permease component RcnA